MKNVVFRLLKVIKISLFMSVLFILGLFLPTNPNLLKLNYDSISLCHIKKLSFDTAVLQNNVWQSLREDDETSALSFLNSLQEKYLAEVVAFKFEKIWQQKAIDRWGEDYFIWYPNECYEILANEAFTQVKDNVRKVAARCGFDEAGIAQISTASYELAGNIYRYAE